MIRDWFRAATARVIEDARQLGFARDLAAYKARWERNASAWQPHLLASRECALEAASRTQDRGLALVLGSGWCLDVPLEELSGQFETVVLADAAHPLEVRRRAERLGNVRLVGCDLTGCLGAVAACARTGRGQAVRPNFPDLPLEGGPGLTVSANTLSFLPLIPMERLWRTSKFDDAELEALARAMVESHLAWLDTLPGVRCLIADRAWLAMDGQDTLVSDPLHGVTPPPPDRRWEWRYAPSPEAHPVRDVVHSVGASIF